MKLAQSETLNEFKLRAPLYLPPAFYKRGALQRQALGPNRFGSAPYGPAARLPLVEAHRPTPPVSLAGDVVSGGNSCLRSAQVLFSRYLGQLKQGLVTVPGVDDWYCADENQAAVLGQKHMHHFNPLD